MKGDAIETPSLEALLGPNSDKCFVFPHAG